MFPPVYRLFQNQPQSFTPQGNLSNKRSSLHFSHTLKTTDSVSLRFGNNKKIEMYLKELRSTIEQTSLNPAVVDNLICSMLCGKDKKDTWYRIPGIREELEDLAVRLQIDFPVLQDKHGIGPRQGWKRY